MIDAFPCGGYKRDDFLNTFPITLGGIIASFKLFFCTLFFFFVQSVMKYSLLVVLVLFVAVVDVTLGGRVEEEVWGRRGRPQTVWVDDGLFAWEDRDVSSLRGLSHEVLVVEKEVQELWRGEKEVRSGNSLWYVCLNGRFVFLFFYLFFFYLIIFIFFFLLLFLFLFASLTNLFSLATQIQEQKPLLSKQFKVCSQQPLLLFPSLLFSSLLLPFSSPRGP